MKPNVVIVMCDQQRADLRKSRGYALDTMPFLDAWAAEGVDFGSAYTPNPTCMPARVSMFTGRYPSAHKVRTNHNQQDVYYEEDMLETLKKAGYTTALCGKNHSHHPDKAFDFAETCGHLGYEGNRRPQTQPEKELADFLQQLGHMEAHQPSPGGVEGQHPYQNVSSAFRFLDKRPADKPFFMWLSFAEPHNPFQVPQPYYDMFPPESLPPLQTGPGACMQKGAKYAWLRGVWESVLGGTGTGEGTGIEGRIARSRSNYHGMLRLIDDQFKRLVEGLAQRGLDDKNTIVLFCADHGDFAGEYGLIRKGPELPEVLCRVPMVWHGPGVQKQGLAQAPCVSLVDVFPTVCDALGLQTPFGVQGKSLLPLLREGEAVPEKEFDTAYAESGFGGLYWNGDDELTLVQEGASSALAPGGRPLDFDCLNTWTQCGQVRMLRKGKYKIQMDMLGTGFLYDLEADPMEVNNLYGNEKYVAVQAEMLAQLMAATLRADDPLPAPRRRYHVKQHPKGYWFQPWQQ